MYKYLLGKKCRHLGISYWFAAFKMDRIFVEGDLRPVHPLSHNDKTVIVFVTESTLAHPALSRRELC
jgi:hypothetical protein